MVQYQKESNGLGIDDMINVLMDRTWKAARLNGLEGLIQKQNEQLLLTYLLSVSVNDDASFANKAQMMKAIDDIKTYATSQLKITSDAQYKGYLLLTLDRIKSPDKARPTMHEPMPPGSPIGCDWNE
jgi:hypothetical protein